MWTDRTENLIGQNGLETLKNSSVLIVGIGGVGGHVSTMLARAGVGKLTLVDFDKVDETNINRQVVATTETVGFFKTLVMKDLILKINPKCTIKTLEKRFEMENSPIIFQEKFDYVIDAIDCVKNKVELITFCKQHDINIVSAMGAGNRIDIPHFEVVDIYETSHDGLAKVMRKKLREQNIKSLDVVTTKEKAMPCEGVGSISYYPAMCGCVIAAYVINKLLKKEI